MPATPTARAVPCLRYRDARAAIDALCWVLGFEASLVVEGATPDEVAHAQLRLGDGMVMLGSVRAGPYGERMRQPDEAGGCTQSVYLVVADPDAVHARVLDAGWRVVIALKDEEYGGRGFSCEDPEGHLWSVGSYDPWA